MNESLNDLKQHLSSVRQTRQITNAMFLLSTSMLKKMLADMEYSVRYRDSLRNTMREILSVTEDAGIRNRYLEVSPKGTALYLSVMGDKGLCGNYNYNVASLTAQVKQTRGNAMLYCFGLEGEEYLKARSLFPDRVLPGSSMHPDLQLARELSKTLIDMYITDEVNEVYIIYTPYRAAKREPVCFRMLPLLPADFTDLTERDAPAELLYEPSAEAVFEHIVPLYCASLLYNILVQACASENAARMDAMQNATSNADTMMQNLQARINAVRQLNITNEITEIAAATSLRERGV